ncbi:hypothetical protein [Parafrankia discariae]|uniref:hypothetical protein n=1 Tax=Parafrankia discariae TaxID=365528 RepID=UPI00037E11FA|nr:hypothetical protein [Parafrankia discariae]
MSELIDLDAVLDNTTSIGDDTEPARVEIFRLGGVVYSVPALVRVNVLLRAAYLAQAQGDGPAEAWMMRELLGEEAHEALLGYASLTADQYTDICVRVQNIAAGRAEPDEGKAKPGSTPGAKRKALAA